MGRGPNKGLSQSFLTSPQIAAAMAQAAEFGQGAVALEIGPGLGILTRELLAVAGRVVCIELDSVLAAQLAESLGEPANLRVVQGDATTIDLEGVVQEPYSLVASLPYHVATPILFRFLFGKPKPRRVVVMLQEEVARRIVAPPGAMTYLAAAFGTVAEAKIVRRVPPGAFFPVPKVRSAIVRLDLRDHPAVDAEPLSGFIHFLRQGFTQPRRQLHNSLSLGLSQGAGAIASVLHAAGVEPSRRPADLSIDEWAAVYRGVQGAGWLEVDQRPAN
jgi:16S rRNA (adenine1518-N6/adenine1519-N6)-dimethyltransferase